MGNLANSHNVTGHLLLDLIEHFGSPVSYECIMQMMESATDEPLSTQGRRTVRQTLEAATKLGFLERTRNCQFMVAPLKAEASLTILSAEEMDEPNESEGFSSDDDDAAASKQELRDRSARRVRSALAHGSKYRKYKPRAKMCPHCQRKRALQN